MFNISILCPTRKRPSNMERLVNSLYDLALMPNKIEVIFYIDTDDVESLAKAEELKNTYKNRIKVVSGERIVLSEMWNKCWELANSDIFFHCGDDIVFRTASWDNIVISTFNQIDDKIAFVHGDDMLHKFPGFGTHGFLHKNWTDTLGYFVPPYFSSDYNDTWLNDVSNSIGRHVCIPIKTEHMHFANGKGPKDITHLERLARHKKDNVAKIYASLASKRQEDAKKLLQYIESYNLKSKKY